MSRAVRGTGRRRTSTPADAAAGWVAPRGTARPVVSQPRRDAEGGRHPPRHGSPRDAGTAPAHRPYRRARADSIGPDDGGRRADMPVRRTHPPRHVGQASRVERQPPSALTSRRWTHGRAIVFGCGGAALSRRRARFPSCPHGDAPLHEPLGVEAAPVVAGGTRSSRPARARGLGGNGVAAWAPRWSGGARLVAALGQPGALRERRRACSAPMKLSGARATCRAAGQAGGGRLARI